VSGKSHFYEANHVVKILPYQEINGATSRTLKTKIIKETKLKVYKAMEVNHGLRITNMLVRLMKQV
jgi:predicted RNase H-related nuclease YkuK (DUF458 family)